MSNFIRIYESRRNSNNSFRVNLPSHTRYLDNHIFDAIRRNTYNFQRCSCTNGQTCRRCEHTSTLTFEDVPQVSISIADVVERALAGEETETVHNLEIIPEYKADETLDDACSICFEKIKKRQKFRALPCSEVKQHCFHTSCIDQWLQRNNSCPVCRAIVM